MDRKEERFQSLYEGKENLVTGCECCEDAREKERDFCYNCGCSLNEKYPQKTAEELWKATERRYGHPRFYELLKELAQLHNDKNHDYAKGGDALGNFKRRAVLYSMYPGLDLSDPAVIPLVDMLKQLDALLWFYSNKHEAKVEGKAGRAKDVSVYSLINMILEEEK